VTIIEAILLGMVQGATELLPISSSGHLLLVPNLLKLPEPDLNVIAIAHQGTLLAILIYFRIDLWAIATGMFDGLKNRQPMSSPESRLGWFIIAGTIPTVIAGLLFANVIGRILTDPIIATLMLIVTGFILIAGERMLSGRIDLTTLTFKDSISIGFAQCFALIPGISRSGITITAGLWRGLDRSTAARFSFLLGVPAIAGAGVLATIELAQSPEIAILIPQLIATFVASAITGYLCILFLLRWVRSHSLYIFAGYCFVFGAINLIVIWIR
jgi:undecaprenyl-diphosphatase